MVQNCNNFKNGDEPFPIPMKAPPQKQKPAQKHGACDCFPCCRSNTKKELKPQKPIKNTTSHVVTQNEPLTFSHPNSAAKNLLQQDFYQNAFAKPDNFPPQCFPAPHSRTSFPKPDIINQYFPAAPLKACNSMYTQTIPSLLPADEILLKSEKAKGFHKEIHHFKDNSEAERNEICIFVPISAFNQKSLVHPQTLQKDYILRRQSDQNLIIEPFEISGDRSTKTENDQTIPTSHNLFEPTLSSVIPPLKDKNGKNHTKPRASQTTMKVFYEPQPVANTCPLLCHNDKQMEKFFEKIRSNNVCATVDDMNHLIKKYTEEMRTRENINHPYDSRNSIEKIQPYSNSHPHVHKSKEKNHCKIPKLKQECSFHEDNNQGSYGKIGNVFQSLTNLVMECKHDEPIKNPQDTKNSLQSQTDSKPYFKIEKYEMSCGKEKIIINKC